MINPIKYFIDKYRRSHAFWKHPDYDEANHSRNIRVANEILGATRCGKAFHMFTEKFRDKLPPPLLSLNIVWQETSDLVKETDEQFLVLFSTAAGLLFRSGKISDDDYNPYYQKYKPALLVLQDYAEGKLDSIDGKAVEQASKNMVNGAVEFLETVLKKVDHKEILASPIGDYIYTDFEKRFADYEQRKANVKI